MKLPREYENVMVMYDYDVPYGPYGMERRTERFTRKGFLSDGYFLMPLSWMPFTFSDGVTEMMPHGFWRHKVHSSKIISWTHIIQDHDS